MRFDENARLDTSGVDDLRGSGGGRGGGVGGRVAGAGGGLGLVGVILYLLLSNFAGVDMSGMGAGGGYPGLDQVGTGQTADNSSLQQNCATGESANTSTDCRVVAVVNSLDDYWATQFSSGFTRRARTSSPAGQHQRLRVGDIGQWAVLLPRRLRDLHRPHLLPGAADPLRREGRTVLAGLRDRPRVRPPHPEPHRHQPPRGQRHRPDLRLGASGAAGRLLRGHLGEPRDDDARPVREAPDHPAGPVRHRRRPRHRVPDRRRLHPVQPGWRPGRRVAVLARQPAQREKWFTTGLQSGNPDSCDTFAARSLD